MIYVHVPFCRSFCTYCDFYSEIACRGKDERAVAAWLDSLCAEAQARSGEIAATLDTDTLYIGGGTPSVLPLGAFRRILEALGRASGPAFAEFTVEVNPEDIVGKGIDYAHGLKALGVNRVSMGVQSLSDDMLRWMNRRHSADGARQAFAMLREAGFDNISVDVIFGISHLSDEMLVDTLGEILSWKPAHVSAYQLSIEEGSALAGMVEDGRYQEAPEEQCRRQYELIGSALRQAGYEHYEISNWALPGRRALHNSAYWTRQPYVGLGPGAHSLRIGPDSQVRSWNSQEPQAWTSECEILSPEEIREERIMLGLRTAEGVDGRRIPEEDWFVSDSIIADLI